MATDVRHKRQSGATAKGARMEPKSKSVVLSRADSLILAALQSNGLMSNAALGESAAVSESAAARHRHRLEQEGYIKRYAAVVDVEKLGYGLAAFMEVGLASQQEDALVAFEAAIQEVEQVMACHALDGEVDYFLRVVARDHHDLERIRHCIGRLPGVKHLHTRIILSDALLREVVPST